LASVDGAVFVNTARPWSLKNID